MRMRRAALCALLALSALGCTPHDDVRARYELERLLWRAQFHQRRINIAFMHAARGDTQRAVDAFRAVVARDPLAAPGAGGWDPAVVDDIRRIQLSARVALAHLYFLGERFADAGTMYEETLRLGSMTLRDELDARLGVARSLYMAGENSVVLEQCAHMFRDVSESAEFWAGGFEVDDVLLNIPVVVVRMYQETGETARYDEYSALAFGFYHRVSRTWPGERVDWQARLARVQLHMVRGEWQEAATLLEEIVKTPGQAAGDAPSLELILGEIRAFPLGETTAAEPIFQGIVERYPGTGAAYAARYDLAALELARGDEESAAQAFRTLEREDGVPGAVAARAMFARARLLEKRGQWDDAWALLRRLIQLYPHTMPALEAPLLITRHYAERGETAMAERALATAREYYLSLLDRSSRFGGDRLMVQSALAESHVVGGRAGEAAELLSAGAGAWDDRSTVAGMLKAAEIYEREVRDTARAEEMLKKVIERFPETRYARVAQHRLDEMKDRP